jgi:hypothetical protein
MRLTLDQVVEAFLDGRHGGGGSLMSSGSDSYRMVS